MLTTVPKDPSTDGPAVSRRIKVSEAVDPGSIPGSVLRACAEELVGVLTDSLNLPLAHAAVPICLKLPSIILAAKHYSVLSW